MKTKPTVGHVLTVDDDDGFARVIAEVAKQCGCEAAHAATLHKARELVGTTGFDLILMDVTLPDGEGLDLLDDLELEKHGRIVVVTGEPSVASAVRVIGSPVVDYLVKPVAASMLQELMVDARGRGEERAELARAAGGMVGQSEPIRMLLDEICRVGPIDVPVLVQGESGTGKELVARGLHAASGRTGEFVAVNCGALAQDLMGSLLFGHERGAFTGAVQSHAGYFEQAAGGTLFLDEIGEMPLPLQVYLLRVLETRTFKRLGGTRELPVDARLVAATNRDPLMCVESGRLRQDLYYRLSGYVLETPALAERRDDIPLLARYFLDMLNRRYGTGKQFTADALVRMTHAAWPGNVRELRHAVQRCYLLAGDAVIVDYRASCNLRVPARSHPSADAIGFAVGMSFEDIEREMLLKTLARCDNNKSRAARMLGITSKTVYNRLVRYRALGLLDEASSRALAKDAPDAELRG